MANSDTYPVVMMDPAPARYMGVIGSASAAIEVPGITEIASGTASAFVLGAVPYLGAIVSVHYSGSASTGRSIITSSAGVTVNNAGDRTITLTSEGDNVTLLGVSATRWHVLNSTATYSA